MISKMLPLAFTAALADLDHPVLETAKSYRSRNSLNVLISGYEVNPDIVRRWCKCIVATGGLYSRRCPRPEFPRGATIILEMDLAGRNKWIATVGAWSGQRQDHREQGIPCSRAKRNCLPGPGITYCCLLPTAFEYCYGGAPLYYCRRPPSPRGELCLVNRCLLHRSSVLSGPCSPRIYLSH